MPMRKHLARLLRKVGWLDFDLVAVKHRDFPDPGALKVDEMVVVVDAKIRKWACLRCPGGCGAPISLSLNPQRRPRWAVITDFWWRPTVSPSVHQLNACGCHFWIKGGVIEWCPGGRPAPTSRQP
jgi:hypothetical protein